MILAMPVTRREMMLAPAPLSLAARAQPPQVSFGPHRISRLIVGGNPVSGNSHWSPALDREMMDYFSAANVKKLLRACEAAGINTWQSRADRHIMRLLREYRNEGGKIQWIAQTASELADVFRNIRDAAAGGAIGVYHHGNRTDALFRSGKLDELRDILKAMKDAGVRAGVGTHVPEVVDVIESKGWEVDFYMTCLYNLTRPKDEVARIAGREIQGEFFYDPDREKMLERVRRTQKPCLVFKVYGATRKCGSAAEMKNAMAQVLRYAKPSDALVIGMFPKYKDQVTENCRLFAEVLREHSG